MKSFLSFFALFSYVMALVSLVCGLAGSITAMETLVFMFTFVAMGFIFIVEIENAPL
jgi:hypothetical protein